MDTPLYLRVRGRVLGPYEPDKLQAMVRRGQLSRLHELSTDGVSWVRASNYPELFAINVEVPAAQQTDVSRVGTATPTDESITETSKSVDTDAAMTASVKWYFSRGDVQGGPVDFPTLKLMAASGQLSPDDLVWTEGMSNWRAANSTPGLSWPTGVSTPAFGLPAHQIRDDQRNRVSSSTATDAELSDSLVRSALNSRGWVLFVSIVMFLFAGLLTLGGIGFMVEGARARQSALVTGGIFPLLTAVVIAVGGFLLISYGNRLGGLRFSRAPILLERALDTLRVFWLYIGICLIVWLVFIVIAIVLGAAQLEL